MGDFELIIKNNSYKFDRSMMLKHSKTINELCSYKEKSSTKEGCTIIPIVSYTIIYDYCNDSVCKKLKEYFLLLDGITLSSSEQSINNTVNLPLGETLINLILTVEHLQIDFIRALIRSKLCELLNSKQNIIVIRENLGFIDDFTDKERKFMLLEMKDYEQYHSKNPEISSDAFDGSLSMLIDNTSKIEDILQMSPSNDIVRFLHRKNVVKFIADQTVSNCQACDTYFSFLLRKHHCRLCGRIYCYNCAKYFISKSSLESDINSFSLFSVLNPLNYIWSSSIDNESIRVCSNCYEIYQTKCIYERFIQAFKYLYLDIQSLKILALISNHCRQASICILSELRQLQYVLPTYVFSEYEYEVLWHSKDQLMGHSAWMFQLLKACWQFQNVARLSVLIHDINNSNSNNKTNISACWKIMCGRNCKPYLNIYDMIYFIYSNVLISNTAMSNISNDIIAICINLLNKISDSKLLLLLPIILLNDRCLKHNTLATYFKHRIKRSKNHELFINTYFILFNLYHGEAETDIVINDLKDNSSLNVDNSVNVNADMNIMDINDESWNYITFDSSMHTDILKHELLNICNPEFAYNFMETYKLLCLFRDKKFKSAKALINEGLCLYVFDTAYKFQAINQIRSLNSFTKPILIDISIHNKDTINKKLLLKFEDLRKDVLMLNIIEFMYNILNSHGIVFPFKSYKVLPITNNFGLIECNMECETLYNILAHGSIMNYLQKNSGERTLNELKFNYMNSLAFWTILTYVLDIRDRHSENILITHDGIVFHIDYGYILGRCGNFLIPEIRLDKQLLDALGGDDEYPRFKTVVSDMFKVLRKYSNLFFNLLNVINYMSVPFKKDPIENANEKDLTNLITSRFFIGQSDKEAEQSFNLLLDQSRDTLRSIVADLVHHYSKSL